MVCITLEIDVFILTSVYRDPAYNDMKDNKPICNKYTSAMNAMGYKTILDAAGQEGGLSSGSTDMGKRTTIVDCVTVF